MEAQGGGLASACAEVETVSRRAADWNKDRATAEKMTVKDVNGDGVKDLVLTFASDKAAKYGFADVRTDLWLFGEIDGEKKGGFDVVRIVK